MSEKEVLEKAIWAYGSTNQIDMCIEEMSELTKALLKGRRYADSEVVNDNIYEEIADVEIMLEQMKMIYGSDKVEMWRKHKIERLEERMKDVE